MTNKVALQVSHQCFEWKALKKPLRLIIQIFTGNYFHTSIMIENDEFKDTFDLVGKGARRMTTDNWIAEYKDLKKLKVYRYYFIPEIDDKKVAAMIAFYEERKNDFYDWKMALVSAIDNSKIKYSVPNGMFCSMFSSEQIQAAKLLPPHKNGSLNDPNELVAWAKKFGLIDSRERVK